MEIFKISEELKNIRLDKALSILLDTSRTNAQTLIDEGYVTVNDKQVKAKYQVQLDDEIQVIKKEKEVLDLKAEDLNITVVYEDDYVAVVYKPEGMVVHPANGNDSGTLVNGLLHEMDIKETINDVVRPGIVHRIDKDTSGLLMIAKNDLAMASLQAQLKDHSCNRRYIALVYGELSAEKGRIEAPIGRDPEDRKKMAVVAGGKEAITNFTVIERFKGYTLVECKLETGRTHQIRVHMKYIGHPLVGDKVYGPRKTSGDKGQYLHAKTIGFMHPKTNEYMEFSHDIPSYFEEFLNELRNL